MARKFTYILALMLLLALAVSCKREEFDAKIEESFSLQLSPQVKHLTGDTRITLFNSITEITDKTLMVSAWEGDNILFSNKGATYDNVNNTWNFAESYKMKPSKSYLFYGYVAETATPEITKTGVNLSVSDISTVQEDVLLGYGSAVSPASGDVDMTYSHPFASVKFVLGAVDNVKSVSAITLSGLYSSGSTSLTALGGDSYIWSSLGDACATLSQDGLNVKTGDDIATFVVIPQDLEEKNAVVTITYLNASSESGQMTKLLASGDWNSGELTTYTLGHVGQVDIAVANQMVTNNGLSDIYIRAIITGAWYKDGNVVAEWDALQGSFSNLPGSGWSEDDEIYYYNSALSGSGGKSSALFSSYSYTDPAPVAGAELKLTILVQAIPYVAGKSCKEAFESL